jgi:predicted dinucleotide-binding enzyme
MNIGIIGAGEIGSCLAAKFIKLGHSVAIANSRGPASLKQLAEDTSAEAATVADVVKNKQVIIVAIPQKNIPDLPQGLFSDLPESAVVIDTGNYYPALRDGVIPGLEQSGIESWWVQEQLGVPVVKVFNSIFATSLNLPGRPKGDKDRIALAVSGDRVADKAIVFELVEELGYDPFDIGIIAQSWKQQPGSTIYCRDIRLAEVKKRVAAMGTDWSELRDTIIGQHHANEAAMAADFSAWLKAFKDQ